MPDKTSHPLKCYCRYKPLLATYGIDEKGKIYIHVKVYKQKRIYANIIFDSGNVRICCRDCERWHTVKIVQKTAELAEVSRPKMLSN